jgi:hypothetical protein
MPKQGLAYLDTKQDPLKNIKEVKALSMKGLYFQYVLFKIWSLGK